jgi:hypothetical protein
VRVNFTETSVKVCHLKDLDVLRGYLVGTIDRWNNGKLAELKDRVKHGTSNSKEE